MNRTLRIWTKRDSSRRKSRPISHLCCGRGWRRFGSESDAAIYAQYLASDVIVRLQQETHRARNILGTAESADRSLLQEAIVLARGDAGLRHSRLHHAGRDHVHPHVGRAPALATTSAVAEPSPPAPPASTISRPRSVSNTDLLQRRVTATHYDQKHAQHRTNAQVYLEESLQDHPDHDCHCGMQHEFGVT